MPDEIWDELEWAAEKPANDLFPRLETPPQRGWVKLYRPYTGGERFHALFQPALSTLNGWTVHPQELLDSAVLECQVLTRFKLLLEVEVLRVTPLTELACPAQPAGPLGPLEHSSGTRAQAGPLHYFETDYERDSGAWAVAREGADGRLWVIVSNQWDATGDLPPARAGNRALTPEQQSHLLSFSVEDFE